MAWQHFNARENVSSRIRPAALAAFAALQAPEGRNAASAASAAGVSSEIGDLIRAETAANAATAARVRANSDFLAEADARPDDAWTDEDWQAAYDERAGILEYDAGLPRAEAERLAREQVFGDRPIGNVRLTVARDGTSR